MSIIDNANQIFFFLALLRAMVSEWISHHWGVRGVWSSAG